MNEDYDLSSLYGEPPPKRQKTVEAEDAEPAEPAVATVRLPVVSRVPLGALRWQIATFKGFTYRKHSSSLGCQGLLAEACCIGCMSVCHYETRSRHEYELPNVSISNLLGCWLE